MKTNSDRYVGDGGRTLCGDLLRPGSRRLCGQCSLDPVPGDPEADGCGAPLGEQNPELAAAELDRLYRRIIIALAAAGLGELDITVYPDGAVVNDGQCLWDVDAQQLNEVAEQIAEERPAERYQTLCGRTTYLGRSLDWMPSDVADEDRERIKAAWSRDHARHERILAAWSRDHDGKEGNWS